MRAVVMVSGRGSNLRALVDARDAGQCDVELVAVVSDRADADALGFAAQRGLATRTVLPRDHADRAAWDVALCETVDAFAPDLVILAGFMRILGAPMIQRFEGRIVNVHPSLLPAFPGKDGPALALAAGVKLSGCTVHLVDAGVDSGPVLAQAAVPVLDTDDRDSLHARIQREEHVLLPRVVHAIATGRLVLGARPRWRATGTPPPHGLRWPNPQE